MGINLKLDSRKIFWIILIVLVITLQLCLWEIHKQEKIPKCVDCNIIFIDVDILRAGHFGSDGYYRNTSPNIDSFAQKSIVFKNTYSQAYWTPLSIRSLLTSSLSVLWEKRAEQNATLPKILKKAGYITAAFTGNLSIQEPLPQLLEPIGFDDMDSTNLQFARVFEYGLDWINTNKKFFLYLHSFDLHDPYNCKYEDYFDPEYNESIGDILFNYVNITLSINKTQDFNFVDLKKAFFTEEQMKHIIAHYDGCILTVDELFGNFVHELKKIGILNRTIIVLFSNHGEDLFENGRVSHLSPSYAVSHVPLIIYIPGTNPQIINAPVTLMDIMPTILSLVNVKTDYSMMGIDLIQLIENPKLTNKDRTIPGYGYTIKGDWEIFTYPTTQLYNLRRDPNESNNLASKNPEKVNELLEARSDFYIKALLQTK